MGITRFAELLEGLQTNYANPDSYPVDSRGLAFTYAYFSAKHLGAGQYYLMTIMDKDGKDFDGSKTYKLHVPLNAPVKLYWSATVYDRATHAFIHDMPTFSRASNTQGLQKNTDGSIDVYFGPKVPAGKENVWIQTTPNKDWFAYFRIYGPEGPAFDGSWKPGDFEKVK